MRMFFACISAIFLMMVFIAPVFANPPVVETEEFDNFFSIPCDGGAFSVDFYDHVTRRTTTHYDRDGAPDRIEIHLNINGTTINTGTGTIFKNHAVLSEFFELPSDPENLEKYIGILWHLTVPGEGLVVLDAGRLIFDEAGNFVSFDGHTEPEFTSDDRTLVCDGVRGK